MYLIDQKRIGSSWSNQDKEVSSFVRPNLDPDKSVRYDLFTVGLMNKVSHSFQSSSLSPIGWAATSLQLDLLKPLKTWLDNFEVSSAERAHWLCQFIPAQCPFERDVKWFGRTLFHIPPMCKLNPCYDQLVGLRFRALCYLADVCGEDISHYC
jgi:hypothetical protein